MKAGFCRKQNAGSFFRSFIPLHVSNPFFLNVYKLLARIQVPQSVRERNLVENREHLHDMDWKFWNQSSAYIENQREWGKIRFGAGPHHNMSYSGCEIIAAFNAKKVFGFPGTAEEMAELIYEFESCGAALWGEFGTSPAAIAKHFERNGFSIIMTVKEDDNAMDKINRECPAVIVTVYNDRHDILKQVHTVCITKESRGYVIHNAYRLDTGGNYNASCPYRTLMEAVGHISRYESKLICAIGIAGMQIASNVHK